MTPEKAIEILQLDKTCDFEGDAHDLEKAIQLGIEALRLNEKMRETYAHPELLVLPSETKE